MAALVASNASPLKTYRGTVHVYGHDLWFGVGSVRTFSQKKNEDPSKVFGCLLHGSTRRFQYRPPEKQTTEVYIYQTHMHYCIGF